jgi:hypothetical protein
MGNCKNKFFGKIAIILTIPIGLFAIIFVLLFSIPLLNKDNIPSLQTVLSITGTL